MTIAITLTIIYIISVIGAYKFSQLASQDFTGFILMITPGLNTVMTIIFVLYYLNNESNINWKKFFNKF